MLGTADQVHAESPFPIDLLMKTRSSLLVQARSQLAGAARTKVASCQQRQQQQKHQYVREICLV